MISIIGAGPAGNYAAYLLAKDGQQVQVFEENSIIGEPIQCTGIVTSSIARMVPIRSDFIVNRISKARIYAPDNNFIEVKLGNENIILNRRRFDQYIAELAREAGAEFYTNHRFLDFKGNEMHIKDTKGNIVKKLKTNVLVGADGPNSQVARATGLFSNRQFWVGSQATIKYKNDNAIEFFPHVGTIGWICPENEEIVRIGICAKSNTADCFNKFLKEKAPNAKILDRQGGLIPIYNPKVKAHKDNVYLIGDAAGHVKATTLGGIIQGMLAAEACHDSIIYGKDYERAWRKKLAADLRLALLMRKAMDKFSHDDYNYLVKLFTRRRTREILESYDRDYPSQFMLKLLIREPRLLYFAKMLL
ncbi:NAD(P)/FAD-dependent oxidoreductase [Candidatus Woesearchaeota archaeon]|nr:NAD(P)/FAD-dependent oxidoreductase [Candidatus Woesearchaeota archaeon]